MLDGESYLRLMRPLATEKRCLKCHGDQGYKEGDIRGGISVSVPMAPYTAIARRKIVLVGVGHGMLWVLGLVALAYGSRHIRQRVRDRDRAEAEVAQARRNLETFFNAVDEFLFVCDVDGRIVRVNDTGLRRLGYAEAELKGQPVFVLHPPDRHEEAQRIIGELRAGRGDSCPVPLMTKNGERIDVETRVTRGEWDGKPVLFGVSKDVTEFSRAKNVKSAQLRLIEYAADHTVTELLQKFLDEAETLTRSKIGFYHFVDVDQETLNLQTWSTNTLKNMCTAEG